MSDILEVKKEFQFLWDSDIPNKVVVAARGSGKTMAVLQHTVQRLLEGRPNGLAVFFSGTLRQVTGTVEPKMRMIMQNFPEGFCRYNISNHEYTFFVNSGDIRKLVLLSYENQEAKRGFHPDTIILDECASIPYNMYGAVIDPMLSTESGILTAIGTPKGHDKFYELYQRGLSKDYPNWESYCLPADKCSAFTSDFLWQKRNNLTSYEYAQEYECDFEANVLVGSVYGDFFNRYTNNNIRDCFAWNPDIPVYTAWDLGFADYTAIWFFQVNHDLVTFIDFFEDNGHDTSYYADILSKKPYTYKLNFLPHDGSRGDMRGLPIQKQLEQLGFRCAGLKRDFESVGIDEARRLLKVCRFNAEKCAIGINHLKSFKYKVDKRTYEKLKETEHDEHSHAADAFRYAAMSKNLWKCNDINRIMVVQGQDYNVLA